MRHWHCIGLRVVSRTSEDRQVSCDHRLMWHAALEWSDCKRRGFTPRQLGGSRGMRSARINQLASLYPERLSMSAVVATSDCESNVVFKQVSLRNLMVCIAMIAALFAVGRLSMPLAILLTSLTLCIALTRMQRIRADASRGLFVSTTIAWCAFAALAITGPGLVLFHHFLCLHPFLSYLFDVWVDGWRQLL